MQSIELDAPAKLNLFLELLRRRPDGYHELDSVFAEISLADRVHLEKADKISLTVEGEPAPADPSNLVWRAAEALGLTARIHLRKRIPAGSGLGGGSSDAAATLQGLVRLHDLAPEPGEITKIARSLGADVPFFLHGGLARCTGIGDEVAPLSGSAARRFVLLLPSLSMSTEAVYGASESGLTGPRENANLFIRRYFGKGGGGPIPYFNRLQDIAERLEPRLRAVRVEAERRLGTPVCLSGSGSAYFAEIGKTGHVPGFEASGTVVRVYEVATET